MSESAARGLQIANRVGCAACHGNARDGASVGPSWVGTWGETIPLEDGREVTFDEDYVISSVRTPDVDRRVGDWLRMPAFELDQVSEAELTDLIAYVRTLGER